MTFRTWVIAVFQAAGGPQRGRPIEQPPERRMENREGAVVEAAGQHEGKQNAVGSLGHESKWVKAHG
jgi:hypothetical protein